MHANVISRVEHLAAKCPCMASSSCVRHTLFLAVENLRCASAAGAAGAGEAGQAEMQMRTMFGRAVHTLLDFFVVRNLTASDCMCAGTAAAPAAGQAGARVKRMSDGTVAGLVSGRDLMVEAQEKRKVWVSIPFWRPPKLPRRAYEY